VVDIAARAVLAAFDRVTGLNLLRDVQAFVGSSTACTKASRRVRHPHRRNFAPETPAIVIVTTAEASRIAQAREFIEALERADLRVAALIVNRVDGTNA